MKRTPLPRSVKRMAVGGYAEPVRKRAKTTPKTCVSKERLHLVRSVLLSHLIPDVCAIIIAYADGFNGELVDCIARPNGFMLLTTLGDGVIVLVNQRSRSHRLEMWNIGLTKRIRTLQCNFAHLISTAFELHNDRLLLITCHATMYVMDLTSNSILVRRPLSIDCDFFDGLVVFQNGNLAISRLDEIDVVDTSTGLCLQTLKHHTHDITSLLLLSTTLASSSSDHTVCIWSLATFTVLTTLQVGRVVTNMIDLANGKIATHFIGDDVGICDIATGLCLTVFDPYYSHKPWESRTMACIQNNLVLLSTFYSANGHIKM